MIKAFKIVTGFGAGEYTEIDREDVARAYHCFLTEGKMITKSGVALRGRNIMRIEPNWNGIMNWNDGYKPTANDLASIPKKNKNLAFNIMSSAKAIAGEAIKKNNTTLLAQPLKLSLPQSKLKRLSSKNSMEEQEPVQFPSIIEGINKKKDGTLSIKLGTPELEPHDTAKLFALGNMQVWVVLKETESTLHDLAIPEIIPEFKSDKTPSQRLRNTLFVLWKKKGEKGNFDVFYKQQMEKIINWVKDNIQAYE